MNSLRGLLHDSNLVSYTVLAESHTIEFLFAPDLRGSQPPDVKLIKVSFHEVSVYFFDHSPFGTILFSIDEADPMDIVRNNWEAIQEANRYSNSLHEADSLETAEIYIKKNSICGFNICVSLGMSGSILAKTMSIEAVG